MKTAGSQKPVSATPSNFGDHEEGAGRTARNIDANESENQDGSEGEDDEDMIVVIDQRLREKFAAFKVGMQVKFIGTRADDDDGEPTLVVKKVRRKN